MSLFASLMSDNREVSSRVPCVLTPNEVVMPHAPLWWQGAVADSIMVWGGESPFEIRKLGCLVVLDTDGTLFPISLPIPPFGRQLWGSA